MPTPLERNALRLIQDIVRDAMGAPLPQDARTQLETVLSSLRTGGVLNESQLGFSTREVTILFADLRGFSAIAEKHPGPVVIQLLNRCFGLMVDIIARHYGIVDKFIGDAIMVIFSADSPQAGDHAWRGVLCGIEMQIAMNELRMRHIEEKAPELYMGIGISSGDVMAGLIGSEAYRAFTIIGEHVNIAARIEALSLRGQILMSEETYAHCREFVHAGAPTAVHVKGKTDLMRVREALGVPSLGKTVPRQDVRSSPRAQVRIKADYWIVKEKVVSGKEAHGVIHDLGYNGALIQLEEPMPLYTELKLGFDLPNVEERLEQIYGRVVSVLQRDGEALSGIEFTSIDSTSSAHVRFFVQMVLQAEY